MRAAIAEARRRLRWSRDEVVATLDAMEPAVIARAYAYFFGVGAVLVSVVPVLPGPQLARPLLVAAAVLVALATCAWVLVTYDRTPRWVLRWLPALGTALVSLVMLGAVPAGAPAYFLIYLWVVLSASYFFGLRAGLLHVAGIALASAAVFAVQGVPHGTVLWVVGMTAFTVTGAMLSLLRERADTLILQLDAAANTDSLTGLPNRRAFEQRLATELYRAKRHGRPLALLACDVDGFKQINDTRGHQCGDEVLQALAEVLAHGRRIDLCARLGGDEFSLLLPETPGAGARRVGARLVAEVAALPAAAGAGLSAGIACFPGDGATEEELQRAADAALYAAKAAGGGRVLAFEPSMARATVA